MKDGEEPDCGMLCCKFKCRPVCVKKPQFPSSIDPFTSEFLEGAFSWGEIQARSRQVFLFGGRKMGLVVIVHVMSINCIQIPLNLWPFDVANAPGSWSWPCPPKAALDDDDD